MVFRCSLKLKGVTWICIQPPWVGPFVESLTPATVQVLQVFLPALHTEVIYLFLCPIGAAK